MTDKTIPYEPVLQTCNELVTLAICLENACSAAIENDKYSHEMVMMRLTVRRMALLADNLTGGDCAGDAEYWADLPLIKQAGGGS